MTNGTWIASKLHLNDRGALLEHAVINLNSNQNWYFSFKKTGFDWSKLVRNHKYFSNIFSRTVYDICGTRIQPDKTGQFASNFAWDVGTGE